MRESPLTLFTIFPQGFATVFHRNPDQDYTGSREQAICAHPPPGEAAAMGGARTTGVVSASFPSNVARSGIRFQNFTACPGLTLRTLIGEFPIACLSSAGVPLSNPKVP